MKIKYVGNFSIFATTFLLLKNIALPAKILTVLKDYISVLKISYTQTGAQFRNFSCQTFAFCIMLACILQFALLLVQLCFKETFTNTAWIFFELTLGPLLCGLAYSGRKTYRWNGAFLISVMIVFLLYLIKCWANVFQEDNMSSNVNEGWELAVPICLAIYTGFAMLYIKKNITDLSAKEELILVLGVFFLIMASVQAMVFYCRFFLFINMVVDYRLFFAVLLLASAVATVIYNIKMSKETVEQQFTAIKYVKSNLSNERVEAYLELVENFLVAERGFRRNDLSVRLLSKELEIPAHAFAQLFNVHLKKGFYQYVAELRIKYAIEQLNNQSFNLTIEALAEDCGFNSKTSFNKYFKEQTGVTPKEFVCDEVLKFEES